MNHTLPPFPPLLSPASPELAASTPMADTGFVAQPPPRFVPTLTEVVKMDAPALAESASHANDASTPQQHPFDAVGVLEDQMVNRLMQRMGNMLEVRIQQKMALLIDEQTRHMAPLLRQEIESAIRAAVRDALAQELKSSQPVTK